MKIELNVTHPSNPLKVFGMVGNVGVCYRAQHSQYQIWVNLDGPVDVEWLVEGDRASQPTATRSINAIYDDSLPFALHVIAATVRELTEVWVEQLLEAELSDAEHVRRP